MPGAKPLLLAILLAASSATSPAADKPFDVYDNLFYPGKPDTTPFGLLPISIVYGYSPVEAKFKDKVLHQHPQKSGPIVIDVESLNLSGKPDEVQANFRTFQSLCAWAHEAVPGRKVGYYGSGLFPKKVGKEYKAEADKLAQAVDAFFPSMYTFNDDRKAWAAKGKDLVKEAHKIAPGKPVYFYLQPQYHGGTPKAHEFIPGDYWSFQLKSARECGADGVVLWSSSKGPPWDDNAEWWRATVKFMKELKQ